MKHLSNHPTNTNLEKLMSVTHARRSSCVALLLAAALLSACADSTGPATEQHDIKAETACSETQGSNTRCE